MGIIVISRGSYTMGKEVGEEVARRLGYSCLSREDLLEASSEFNVPELRLLGLDPPVLENMVYRKKRYLSFIRSSLFRRLKEDNVVYHGFSGHVLVRDLPEILKVRVEADLQDRARIAALREGVTQERAVGMVKRIDENRKRWCRQLYGVDVCHSNWFDLVINASRISLEGTVELICGLARSPRFTITSETLAKMEALCLSDEEVVGMMPQGEETVAGYFAAVMDV